MVTHPMFRNQAKPENLMFPTLFNIKNQVLSFVLIHLNLISNFQAVNADGVLVSGADNGTMYFWDWKTGYNFQRLLVTK